MSNILVALGALNACFAVIAGAFAAHGLKKILDEKSLSLVQTAAEYQFYHALGILVILALYFHKPTQIHLTSAWIMFAGIIMFSGSLYVLALTGMKPLGMITPIGGTAFIIAWIMIAWHYFTA